MFFEARAFTALYGDLTGRQQVTALFRNVLGREPADAGLTFRTNQMDNPDNDFGLGQLGLQFAVAAETGARFAPLLDAFVGHVPGRGVAGAVIGFLGRVGLRKPI